MSDCYFSSCHVMRMSCVTTSMHAYSIGCLESVEWNGGMEHWNGILEWNTGMKVIISINIID